MPEEESQCLQMVLFYTLLVILQKPGGVCKCWKVTGLRPEVSQALGTAVWLQLWGLTWEGLLFEQPLSTSRAKLQS